MKNFERLFLLMGCGGLCVTVVLAFVLADVQARQRTAPFQLAAVEAVSAAQGAPLRLQLRGQGLDARTRVNLVLDTGHRGAVVGSLATPGILEQVRLAGNLAYLAGSYAGVQVVDIADPLRPRVLGVERESFKSAWDLEVDGHLVYVSDARRGLVVLDVSDPTRPQKIGSYLTADACLGIAHSASLGLVALAQGKNGVLILDVRDPSAPREVARLASADFSWSLKFQGSLAVVADGRAGLRIVDFRDPSRPEIVAAVAGGRHFRGVAVQDSLVFGLEIGRGLVVVDAREPHLPKIVGELAVPGAPWDLRVRGDRVYLANNNQGISAVDVSDPTRPRSLGLVQTSMAARGLDVNGGHLFVAGSREGLRIVALDRINPRQSLLEIPTQGPVRTLMGHGEALFAAVAGRGIKRIYADGQAQAVPPAYFGRALQGRQGALSGSWLFVAAGDQGLQIFQRETPEKFTRIGEFSAGGFVRRVLLDEQGKRSFLALGPQGVQVVDATQPRKPRLLQSLSGLGNVVDLALCGEQLAALDQGGKVHLLSRGEAQELRLTVSYALPDLLESLACDAERVYVGGRNSGFYQIDRTGDAEPLHLARQLPVLKGSRIQVFGDRLYVSGRTGEKMQDLYILSLENSREPEVLAQRSFADVVALQVVDEVLHLVRNSQLETWDLRDARGPRQVHAQPYAGDIVSLIGQGTELLAFHDGGLVHRLERSDPLRPVPLALAVESFGDVLGMRALGEHLLVIDRGTGLHVFSDPAAPMPEPVAALGFPHALWSWDLQGDRAYFLDGAGELLVVDLGQPQAPKILARSSLGTASRRVIRVRGDLLFSAGKDEGLEVWELSDSAPPRLLGAALLPWPHREFVSVLDMVLMGDRVLVASGDAGLAVFEWTAEGRPRLVNTLGLPGYCRKVRVHQKMALVGTPRHGIHLIDFADAQRPVLVGNLPIQGAVHDFIVEKDRVWLAQQDGVSSVPLPLPATRLVVQGDELLEAEFAKLPSPGVYSVQVLRGAEKMEIFGALGLSR